MGEAKRTEFKVGKELGEGDAFYRRGPMKIYKKDDMIKQIGDVAYHEWGKHSCLDFDNVQGRPLKGDGQTYAMKYQVKSEAPFTMQDGTVYTLTCEETGWLNETWIIGPLTTTEDDGVRVTGNNRFNWLDRASCEQTWTLVDAHGTTMHTWKNPVNFTQRIQDPLGRLNSFNFEDGCNAPEDEEKMAPFVPNYNNLSYKQLQATSDAPGLHKSSYMDYKKTADFSEQDINCGSLLMFGCMALAGGGGGADPGGGQSHMSVMVEDGADAVLALAVAYAMAENCVAIGPVPNKREQDVMPELKAKKKNAKDEVMGCKELFERGLPDGYYFKPSVGVTGVANPYKGMTPWEIPGVGSPPPGWTGKTMK